MDRLLLGVADITAEIDILRQDVTRDHYLKQVRRIQDELERGEAYQINYTFGLDFE